MMRRLLRISFWLTCAAVAVLSLLPTDYLPAEVLDWWDKAQHALAFAALCFLGLLAYPSRGRVVLPGLLALAAGIEMAQAATGWRYGDFSDLLADVVGLAAGWSGWSRLNCITQQSPI